MTLRHESTPPDIKRDGSFADHALEQEFRAHIWERECRQLHTISLPVAISFLAPLPIDGSVLGWSNPVFFVDLAFRLFAVVMSLVTFYIYRQPPEDQRALGVAFATTLAASASILFAAASGANNIEIGALVVLTATLCFWTFVPLGANKLLISGASIGIGYMAVLLFLVPGDLQLMIFNPILLILINSLGFVHVRNRNMSERREMLINKELLATTEDLRKEMANRIAAEKHAGANEEIFQGVFASCPVPLTMVDLETQQLVRSNRLMAELLGYQEDETPDRPIRDFFVDEHVFEAVSQELMQERFLHHNEVLLQTKDGNQKWTLLSARRFSMPDRETVLASFVDITDQKEREIDLAVAIEDAEEANFAKSQFLANMSHELRTPLNAIIGFSDIMESEVFGALNNDRYVGYVSDIKSSGVHLLSIINEILDLSKIEAGNEELHQEDVDLNETVDIATRLVRHHAQEKSLRIDLILARDELMLMGDERAIKQIILNLLSNAVKFTADNGVITISTRKIGSRLIVEIADTGIGIPQDQLHTITQPFVQLESTLTNSRAGTGLGLSIATRLAELHGGQIDIESTEGKGTTARLTLPHIKDEILVI